MKTLVFFIGMLPFFVKADGFKFKIKNTTKNELSVFYKISKKSGYFKLKTLIKLKPGEERVKEVSVSKGDTISFYGQNAEDQTSAIVRKDFETQADAVNKNNLTDAFNNKARIFNSHLKEINTLIKQLNQTNSDIIKMSESGIDKQYKGYANNSAGLLNEIVVSNKIIRKE